MNENNLGGRIADLLKKSGLTERELADKVGVTEVSMSRYISGDRIPKGPIIVNIANALHTTSDYLLGIGEDITKEQKTIAGIVGVVKEDREKSKTVTDILEEVKQEICDEYCVYTKMIPNFNQECKDICDRCPLNKL